MKIAVLCVFYVAITLAASASLDPDLSLTEMDSSLGDRESILRNLFTMTKEKGGNIDTTSVSTMAATLGEERMDALETRLASAEAKRQRQLNLEQDKQIATLQTRLGSLKDIIVKLKNSYTKQTGVAKQLLSAVARKNGISGVGAVKNPEVRTAPIPNPASKEAQKLADETMKAHPSSFDQQIRALLEQVKNEARQIYSQQAQREMSQLANSNSNDAAAPSRLPVKNADNKKPAHPSPSPSPSPASSSKTPSSSAPASSSNNNKAATTSGSSASVAARSSSASGAARAAPGAPPKSHHNKNVASKKSHKKKDKKKRKHRFKKKTFKPIYHKAGNEPGEDLMAADDQTNRVNDIMTNYPVIPALQMQDPATIAYKQSLPTEVPLVGDV